MFSNGDAVQSIRHFFQPYPVDTAAFSLHGIGIREKMPKCRVDRPEGTGDFLFMLFYGPVEIRVDGVWRDEGGPVLVLWAPENGHGYGNRRRGFCHSWLHCGGTWPGQLLQRLHLPLCTPLPGTDPARWEACLTALYEEATRPPVPDEVIACNLLENWLRDLARQRQGRAVHAAPERLRRVKQLIETQFAQPHSLRSLAAVAHLSEPHLCSEFRRWFGLSPMAAVGRRRLEEAAYLLRDQNLTVTEVARRVGFGDLYHFSRRFKQCYGKSPRVWRKSLGAG